MNSFALWTILTLVPAPAFETPFEEALEKAAQACKTKDLDAAKQWVDRAIERDPKSPEAWAMRARWAEISENQDDLIYSLHQEYRLRVAQTEDASDVGNLRGRLLETDPMAQSLLDLKEVYVDKLRPVAEQYEKDLRPHSAIQVHKQILALDPEDEKSKQAIARISNLPDPSLAESAKSQDVMAGVSEEFVRKHDKKHSSWDKKARFEGENYDTFTSAGYEVLVRTAQSMEQMNAFYREFFQYGGKGDKRKVPKIRLHIFKSHEEYLNRGQGPKSWSGGQYTGGSVETYVPPGGFSSMVGTLFHEAAHQFTDLATDAEGWLNEGLASFFEGTRILSNGTVAMNYPANNRLFPLAARMERGFMEDHREVRGMSPPYELAPTFRMVLENKYEWGPPWYSPTWGVVYFLYNFQDPADGRFVYRDAFREFIDSSAGRTGDAAIQNFEETVLRRPSDPSPGVDPTPSLPTTVDELDPVWTEWLLHLRDETVGRIDVERPYKEWAAHSVSREDYATAKEFYEKGLLENPDDIDLLEPFADLLADHLANADRAVKLIRHGLFVLEWADEPDGERIKKLEKKLARWDPQIKALQEIHAQLRATTVGLANRYLQAQLPSMAMEVGKSFGDALGFADLYRAFEEGLAAKGHGLDVWQLAYNESDMTGWHGDNEIWYADDINLRGGFPAKDDNDYSTRLVTFDKVTSGDFSLEGEVWSGPGTIRFTGIVFGGKDDSNHQAVILHPPKADGSRSAYVDLATFHDTGNRVHRSDPIGATEGAWHKLRVDVVGASADVWVDGKLFTTHRYPSRDILEGSFGLITGSGESVWRNVKYLARERNDRSGKLERDIRIGELEERLAAEGRTLGDSMVGRVPPFPTVNGWVQEPLESWNDLQGAPTILVFWSIAQNDILPLHDWLQAAVEDYSHVRLKVISVCAADDYPNLEEYLLQYPFPGSVAGDIHLRRGYGETFEKYLIQQYSLPRVLVLDVDKKVVWEGEPGFRQDEPWFQGMTTAIDTPLQDLIARRNLEESFAWLDQWERQAESALSQGDLEPAVPLLMELKGMGRKVNHPRMKELQRKLSTLEAALVGIDATAQDFRKNQAEAALEVLFDWAKVLKHPSEKALRQAEFRKLLVSPNVKSWDSAVRLAERTARKIKRAKPEAGMKAVNAALPEFQELQGLFGTMLHESLKDAVAAGDYEAVKEVLDEAPTLPGTWILKDFLHW